VLGAKSRFDPEKCQKERFAPLPAVFLEGLLTKLSKMKTRPPSFSQNGFFDENPVEKTALSNNLSRFAPSSRPE